MTPQPPTDAARDLLPCPFCGKGDAFVEQSTFASSYVICNHCSARGPDSCQDSDDEDEPGRDAAIAAWNTRQQPEAGREEQYRWQQAIGAEIDRQCGIGAGTCGTLDDGSGLFEVHASLDLNGFAQAMIAATRLAVPTVVGREEVAPATCGAAPDHADIMETIENASHDWQKNGYTSALAEVRDMANVGRALMEALPAGYSYMNCPSEIVSDLQNERDEALLSHAEAGGAEVPSDAALRAKEADSAAWRFVLGLAEQQSGTKADLQIGLRLIADYARRSLGLPSLLAASPAAVAGGGGMKCGACGVDLRDDDTFRTDDDGFTGCRPCFPVSNRPADSDRMMEGPCYRDRAAVAGGGV